MGLAVLLAAASTLGQLTPESEAVFKGAAYAQANAGGGGTGGTGNAFSLVATNAAVNSGVTVTIGAGAVGDLIVCGVKWEYGTQLANLSGMSGSVNGAYTLCSPCTNSAKTTAGVFGYKVSGSALGETITASWGGTKHTSEQLFVLRARASGTIALDTQAKGTGTAAGMATSTFTTAVANGLTYCLFADQNNATVTSPQIGGAAPTAGNPTTQPAGPESWSWYTFTSSQLVNATASGTQDKSGSSWVLVSASFKAQ